MTDPFVERDIIGEPYSDPNSDRRVLRSLADGCVVDPDKTLQDIDRECDYGCFPTREQTDRVDALIIALKAWIDGGGREPNWKRWSRGTGEYKWRLTHDREGGRNGLNRN